jgi:hypothetical protein
MDTFCLELITPGKIYIGFIIEIISCLCDEVSNTASFYCMNWNSSVQEYEICCSHCGEN